MQSLTGQLYHFFKNRISQRNLKLLISFVINLSGLIIFNVILFIYLMKLEGQDYSFWNGLYWILTIFTTLGLGDIVFTSTLGHLFTIWVLISGMTALFVLTPYVLYQFFQSETRAPRNLYSGTKNHIIVIGYNMITQALIDYFMRTGQSYVLIISELKEGLQLHDKDLCVVVGDIYDAETYKNVRIDHGIMAVAAGNDMANSNIALTIRETNETIPIIATSSPGQEKILKAAGCTYVIPLDMMIGKSLTRRILTGNAIAHPVGVFEKFIIAESSMVNTPVIGKTLKEANLREICGINVIGIWDRGRYHHAGADTIIRKNSILVLAGTRDQIDTYNALFCIYNVSDPAVVIIGAENVSASVAKELEKRQINYEILDIPLIDSGSGNEKQNQVFELEKMLQQIKIKKLNTAIITTENDDINIFLTLSLRELRPDIQIISRTISEMNVSTLYRAGADFVISYATLGASAIANIIRGGDLLILTEGLNILKLDTPAKLAGKKIMESAIRQKTGCSIIAIQYDDSFLVNPGPEEILPKKSKIFIIGNIEAEKEFYKYFKN
ncbi:MAG: potassium channel protein [Calditrichaceae bacterium]|nr:potassium channel protein [Calditrichaceae bacterium]MBN2709772.1 potassium channel protein [Calditrichaceae bacterium]RQV94966.1 MAG: potassium channel protein [Calditrichota bacterium]